MNLPRALSVVLVGASILATAGFVGFSDGFAPDAELWEEWQAHDPNSPAQVETDAWGELLARYLHTDADGVARFAYGDVAEEDRRTLDAMLADWAAIPIAQYARAEQLPYWLNLYNALTVALILEHYPVDSIQDISFGLFGGGPWDAERITVEGRALTLNDIEHRILRPIWRDARLHYALNCASVGCPNLRASPWRSEDMEAALDEAALLYVNHPRGFHIAADGRAVVSKIYAWFIEDFGGDEAGVLAHLRAYAEGETAERLETLDSLDESAYDWALNAHPAPSEP